MTYPADLAYSKEHEWVRGPLEEGAEVVVGITAHAADALGDVVFVDPPQVGAAVIAGEVCGELESTKAVSELYSPVSGEVVAVNDALDPAPETINSDPYGEGWIVKVKLSGAPEGLMDAAGYEGLLG